jgi:hypothetical protein
MLRQQTNSIKAELKTFVKEDWIAFAHSEYQKNLVAPDLHI